jgi:hypothetical protein
MQFSGTTGYRSRADGICWAAWQDVPMSHRDRAIGESLVLCISQAGSSRGGLL